MIDSSAVSTQPETSWTHLWQLSFPLATVLGASSAAFVYFGMLIGGRPLTLGTAILAGLPEWYFWALLTPLVFRVGTRFRFDHLGLRALGALVPIGVVVVLVELLLFTTFNHLFYYNPWAPAPSAFPDAYLRDIFRSFHFGYLIYWVIVAAAQSYAYYLEAEQRARQSLLLRERNAVLHGMLSRTQLEVLRAQVHPHFLFNAFNTISSLIREGRSTDATDMVAHLGQLFRLTLKVSERHTIPFSDELQLVHAYSRIAQARFGDRLTMQIEVPDALLDCEVPSMLLQPLVENAVQHGLRVQRGGSVLVGATRVPRGLCIYVKDSGSDGASRTSEGSGFSIGIANLRARLERLYDGDYEFDLHTEPSGGTTVSIRIPMRRGSDRIELAS